MNVFYEEDGGFKAGTVLADQGGAFQVELASGKRDKVKAGHVLIEFRDPAAAALMRDAEALAGEIDLDFLWECAPQAEFAFGELGADYFGHAPTAIEGAALLMRLHGAPMYFYRKGKGRYKPAPPDSLKAALAGVERKKQQALQQAAWVEELRQSRLPDAFAGKVRELLFKPDKNSIEFKALEEASNALAMNPVRLMLAVGGLASPKEVHLQRFLLANFPRGAGFPDLAPPPVGDVLPLATVAAFSVDDHTTTEIDDALSVQAIADGWRIGVHIAAPGLAIQPGDAIDAIARDRYSTVYMPGDKITMLPDSVVQAYTLEAGRACPALSLYVDVRAADWSVSASFSQAELVPIAHNLRHNALDAVITEENLASGAGDYPCKDDIAVLWQFAQALYDRRQQARVASGLRPEAGNRADYNFYIETVAGAEHVTISERKRGAPLDKIVAELMILANSTWGKLLADRGVPGIYRAQQGFGAAGRVRMVTHAAPHQGLGVAQYAWSTSPLRRYVDLANQWQLLACVRNTTAPFKKNDAELFAIVSGFDAAYAAYADFQATMERYWCLRWLEQERQAGASRVTEALVQREDWVRLPHIPLQLRVPGLPELPRGTRVEIELIATDLVDLTVECRLLAIIEEVDADAIDESGDGDGAGAPIDAEAAALEQNTVDAAVLVETPGPGPDGP